MAQQAGFQKYDPTASAPYTPVQTPEPTPAIPSPLPTQGPQINGAVKTSGAVATVADGILRGFMAGRSMAEAKKVMQLKSKSDSLQASYNQDAQQLYRMTQAGVDQNSPEYKQAQAAVQGSWGALMDFYGQHIEQDKGKKKSGNRFKRAGEDILSALHSPDPMEQSRAWYQVAQKAGPPVLSQIAMLNTPAAKAGRQAETNAASNAVTATGIQGQQLTHEQNVANAQATIDNLNKTPRDQWTPAMQQQYEAASQTLTPIQVLKPGEEAQRAADDIVRKMEEDPNYKLTDHDKQVFEAAGIHIDPKKQIHVTGRGEIIETDQDGKYTVLRGPQKEYMPRGGGGTGSSTQKAWDKWQAYYKEHYPDMPEEERDALVERKVEGVSQHQQSEIQYSAIAQPRKFDNAVLTAAISRLENLPEYRNLANFSDAVANLVGQDDQGYAYNGHLAAPRSDGQYSGNVTKAQLQKMDRDLQEQIRQVLNDPKNGLSQSEKRAAMSRMRPLFGPAAQPKGSGNPPVPPPAPAAQPAAAASSQPPHGSKKESDPLNILD